MEKPLDPIPYLILMAIRDGQSTRPEILDRLAGVNVGMQRANFYRHVNPLVRAGLIAKQPEKVRSGQKQYTENRLSMTEAGRAALERTRDFYAHITNGGSS